MANRLRVSMIVIGDEILSGFVQDTNSGWVARWLQGAGVPLDRVVTVPDEVDAIGEALTAELARSRPRVVLTSGGIGSTPDDLTMDAVASHLGVGVTVEATIDARISAALESTARHGVTVSEAHERSMRRMARVPEDAYLLSTDGGFSPGVAVDVDGGSRAEGATIVIMPGVPSELRRIVEHAVQPVLLDGRGEPQHVVEVRHPYPESALNPALTEVVTAHPEVHLGSYPGRECTIRLKGAYETVEAAAETIRAAVAVLDADPGMARLRALWQERWQD